VKIAIGSDHAGLSQKKKLVSYLLKQGHSVLDLGCYLESSCDYPDFARSVSEAVVKKRAERGILICGTGIGMAMAANKIRGIRAAVSWSPETARLAAEHNNANVLCFSGRFLPPDKARRMVREWLSTPFGGGRHKRRLRKIARMEA
jgi:ribose 5-phosphate isomerase B